MPSFKYFQTIVQMRVPIADDGTAGKPEIVKLFSTELYKDPVAKKEAPDTSTKFKEDAYL